MKLENRTWVLVADGAKALVLANEGDADIMNLRRVSVAEETHARTHELGPGKPGTVRESATTARSAHTGADLHDAAEQAFLRTVADSLAEHLRNGRFSRLVVIAPARAMAVLRAATGREVGNRIVAELTKDLTGHTIPDIEKTISDWSPVP